MQPLLCPAVAARRDVSTALAPSSAKALASWQWFNYVAGAVQRGRRLLRINVDETAICLFQGGGRGNVFLKKAEDCHQHASLSQRRTYLTHVAFICDDAAAAAVHCRWKSIAECC